MFRSFSFLALAILGCDSDLDPSGAGKACDQTGACSSGYVCDFERGICVEPGSVIAHGSDAAVDVQLPDATSCESPVDYFLDSDGDGFGRDDVTAPACDEPDGWALANGDCADDTASAFPGQTQFFGLGYTVGEGAVSFDYDCNGQEELDGSQAGQAPECPGMVDCEGEGFVATARTGAGIDPLCGSGTLVKCEQDFLSCVNQVSPAEEPKRCR
jgi:hypothetical protein